MQPHIDFATQLAALEKCCAWIFVPKGSKGGKLTVSARLMLKPVDGLSSAEIEAVAQVFNDWPTWLATTPWTPPVHLAFVEGTGAPVVRRVGDLELQKAFKKMCGLLRLPQIAAVWGAACPAPGEAVDADTPSQADTYVAKPHSAAAKSSRALFGALHSLSVAASLDDNAKPITEIGSTAFNFANVKGDLVAAAAKVEGSFKRLADFARSPADRVAPTPDSVPAKAMAARRQRDPVLAWAAETQPRGLIDWTHELEGEPSEDTAILPVLRILAGAAPDTDASRRALKDARAKKRLSGSGEPRRVLRLSQHLQLIAHHGWLLRYLGLAIDFEIDWTPSTPHPLVTRAPEASPGVVVVCPDTGWPCMNPAQSRGAAPRGLPQSSGIVQFADSYNGKPRFAILQLEVQAAAHKLVQMTASQRSTTLSASDPTVKTFETSAQRSAGLTVVDLAAGQAKDNSGLRKARPGEFKVLFAEDVTIGIRPDVQTLRMRENKQPLQTPWKSLTGWKIRSAHIKAHGIGHLLHQTADVTESFDSVLAGESVVGASHRLLASGDNIVALSSEELFTWDGWSLAVGHPDPGSEGSSPAYSTLKVNDLEITLQASGDLPSLRVGDGYRFAARSVYVDGGGLSLEEGRGLYACGGTRPFVGQVDLDATDAQEESSDVFEPCLRFEPLAPPDIHLGEKLDYADFPQAAARKAVLSSSAQRARVRKREIRWAVPPAVSLEQAITLGMYDAVERRGRAPESAFKGVCLTAEGRFPNVSSPAIAPDASGTTRRSSSGDGSDTLFHASAFAQDPIIPYLPDPWARRVIVGVFRSSDSELLAWEYHDYYPDGDLAGWPNCQPLKLEMLRAQDRYVALPQAYGSASGHVDLVKDGHTMVLVVPPGENLHVRLWHEMDERMLTHSAIVDQMADYLAERPADQSAQGFDVLAGTACAADPKRTRSALIGCLSQWSELRHARVRAQISRGRAKGLTNITSFGMLNPSQTLDVIHAVDTPSAPSFLWSGLPSEEFQANFLDRFVIDVPARKLRALEQSFRFRREHARSDASLAGDVEFDRATIQRLDIEAHWEDLDDDPTQPGPSMSRKNAVLSVDNLPPILSRPKNVPDHQPNTRPTPDVPEDNNLLLLAGVRTRLGRQSNEDLAEKQLLVNFGDSRARIVDLSVTGHSRFAAEYPNDGIPLRSPAGQLQRVVCPASAPPRPVELDYVIPQYRWLDNVDGHRSHVREGGCFRVWLHRPWGSSGPDERLAVVCWPTENFEANFIKSSAYSAILNLCKPNVDPPAFFERFVTRWGLDPLWKGPDNACLGSIPSEAFRRHVCDVASLPARTRQDACFPVVDLRDCIAVRDQIASYESGDTRVALVLYEPKYDPRSRRWYADIQIDEKYAYYPFVRLALARYQRYALPGMELSGILQQEFVQLPPQRRTRLIIQNTTRSAAGTSVSLGVTVSGAPGLPFDANAWRTRVGARLEYLPLKTWQRLATPQAGGRVRGFHDMAWVPDRPLRDLAYDARRGLWQLVPEATTLLQDDRIYSVVVEECELGLQDDGGSFESKPVVRRVFRDRLLVSELP
ncbi:MAG: hypothetical protein ABIR54_00965 [Burkholderiaceae bacterium]